MRCPVQLLKKESFNAPAGLGFLIGEFEDVSSINLNRKSVQGRLKRSVDPVGMVFFHLQETAIP